MPLNHPHILTVHDVGEFECSQYLVAELVDGGTLKDWAAAERRAWRQIVELLIGAADGLASAHHAGILHRDVKPLNVLVAKSGYAKLADFGLAKLSPAGPTDVTSVPTAEETRVGTVVGTVAYMSPEQAAGKALDARSDVFSFGVALYKLLAGRRPFAGASEFETLQSIMHSSAPSLGPTIPFPLRIIVEKSIEKDPADRYQTMRDLVVDLRRVARRPSEDLGRDIATAVAPPAPKRFWLCVVSRCIDCRWSCRSGDGSVRRRRPLPLPPAYQFQRITDIVGIEMPAVSRTEKTIAYISHHSRGVVTSGCACWLVVLQCRLRAMMPITIIRVGFLIRVRSCFLARRPRKASRALSGKCRRSGERRDAWRPLQAAPISAMTAAGLPPFNYLTTASRW